jgi:hypothetical protein
MLQRVALWRYDTVNEASEPIIVMQAGSKESMNGSTKSMLVRCMPICFNGIGS